MAAPGADCGHKSLDDVDHSLRAWVGGLPDAVTKEELQSHFESVGTCTFAAILGKQTGAVALSSPEEVSNAINTLNGSVLKGSSIQVDKWEQKSRTEGCEKGWGFKGKGKYAGAGVQVWQPMMQKVWNMMMMKGYYGKGLGKGWGKGWGKDFGKDWGKESGKGKGRRDAWKLQEIDVSLKVWIGNLTPEIRWQDVEDYFCEKVGDVQWVEKLGKDVACVAFHTTNNVTAALALDGAELQGQALQVDVWTEKSRSSKGEGKNVAA